MKKTEFVYLNNGLVNSEKAHISIHDLGILHGVGLFETLRCYYGKPLRLDYHLDRLFDSAKTLEMNITLTRDQLTGSVSELLAANELAGDSRIRLTVTPGSFKDADPVKPPLNTLFITSAAMTGYPAELYQHGMTACLSSYRQNANDPLTRHKTLNYFSRLMALQEAQRKKTGEALLFTPANRLAQGSISNVFLVRDGTLLTPPLSTPVVPGVTRRIVLELAAINTIPCQEKELHINDVFDAAEMFLTNSVMELMPICRFEAHDFGGPGPGPVYQRLHQLYRQEIQKLQ